MRRGVERLRAHTSRRVLGGLTAGFLLAALLVSGALQARTRLDNWSTDYPLIIGNERTGDRPWRGRVVALSMSDTATPLASLRRFAAGEPLALRGTPVAAFDFTGSPPYSDAAGNVPDLHWTGPPSSGHTGANLTGSSWLRTSGPAATLADRLRKTSAFTLRIKCATDDTDQDGPARIVSNSASPFLRNFTLGQQGGDLVFRLRTPETGANGYPLEVLVPGVFSDFNPSEILVSYDGATLLVATDRSGDVSRTDLGPGSGVALAIQSLNVRADELELYQLAYVALLALVPGVLMGLLGHTTRDRQVFGGGWVLAFAVLLEATLVQASGRAFDWANVALTAGVAAVVCTVFSTALSQADVTWAGSFRPDVWRRAT